VTNGGEYADAAHRYRLESRIATGGMGVVWRATDTRLNRPVAVKVLKHEYTDDPQFRARFETEARNAAALQHPGIAGVYDYASDPQGAEAPYLVMELVEGEPLSTLLQQARTSGRTLDPDVVRDLLAQTADALAVAHRAGIVHRDVKPANLIVTPDRKVKVTDFGIARAADSAQITRTGAVMGTPQYLSPEQARGNPSTPASDVYALGVVAFECLVGRRPFEAESAVATALAHLQQPVPELPADVPPDLAAIVRRALAKDPAERYADGAALAAALRGASTGAVATQSDDATVVLPAGGVPVTAPVPAGSPTPHLDRPTAYEGEQQDQDSGRRKRIVAIVVVVLLLIAAAVTAAVLLLGGDGEDPVAEDTETPRRTRTTQQTSPSPTETTEPTTPTTTAPETVEVNEREFIGRNVFQVEAELQRAGLNVRLFEDDNPGGETPEDVNDVSPTGTLTVGDTVDVHYWGPEPPPPTTPETTETTETTPPTTETTQTEGEGE
jgi:serine/threonine-protein kinase